MRERCSSHKTMLVGRNSSVGRALDWRSKGPWFNPGFRQAETPRRSTMFWSAQNMNRRCTEGSTTLYQWSLVSVRLDIPLNPSQENRDRVHSMSPKIRQTVAKWLSGLMNATALRTDFGCGNGFAWLQDHAHPGQTRITTWYIRRRLQGIQGFS